MTDADIQKAEELLIAQAQTNFSGFFKWVSTLNGMIKDQVGPQWGLIVNNPDVNVAEGKVSGTLDASRPLKEVLSIPFEIKGDRISFTHAKFELTDKLTGAKTTEFTSSATHDINRILADIIQDYIG
ncbi:MAG TPA: hypothetical protein VEQ35_04090 [Beijerinckia sp.]|jgi:hypothetical protein|nr:hypothetical protein [Beijerinckia sp.]